MTVSKALRCQHHVLNSNPVFPERGLGKRQRQEDRNGGHRDVFVHSVLFSSLSPSTHCALSPHSTAQSWRTHGDRFIVLNTTRYINKRPPGVHEVIQVLWCCLWLRPLMRFLPEPTRPSSPHHGSMIGQSLGSMTRTSVLGTRGFIAVISIVLEGML